MAKIPTYRGINYDTGTDYLPGVHSRQEWTSTIMREDVTTIRERLHCNAVNIFGSHPEHIAECARFAARSGLAVWVQPRPVDLGDEEAFALIGEVAGIAESLRAGGAEVRLNAGCEFSLFAPGMIPGGNYRSRARALYVLWPAMPLINRLLDRYLRRVLAVARDRFSGEITYGSGFWEGVDWSGFDQVGVNLYRDSYNAKGFETTVAGLRDHGKPVLITEFGCCGYPGADRRGAGGDSVIDWRDPASPRVKGDHPRDEGVQSRYIAELLDVFAAHEVDGAFVFEFSEPTYPRSADPRRDIYVASFGVLAAQPVDAADRSTRSARPYDLVPKAAFHEIARRFGEAGPSPAR